MTVPSPGAKARRRGLHLGPIPVTPLNALIAALLFGAPAMMLISIAAIKDDRQVTFLEAGAVGLTIGFGLWALASLRAMWRAASMARSGRAMAFAIVGGLAGIGAIGSFAMTMILALLWGG
jgi:hypothetical protein